MSNPAIETALDAFVERLTPVSYRTAGVKPTTIDVSLPPDDLRAIGTLLLEAYDSAKAAWLDERESALDEIQTLTSEAAGLTAQVSSLQAEVTRLTEAATSPAKPVVPKTEAP